MTWLQPAAEAVPHVVKPGCAREIDRSLGRQKVNAVIFAAASMVGISFVITLLTAMKKTLPMMMILMMLITMTSRRRVITRTSWTSGPGSEEIAFSLFCVGHWNVSLKKLKGIFMIQPHFQASVIDWPVLHNLKGTLIGVIFFIVLTICRSRLLFAISGCQTEF